MPLRQCVQPCHFFVGQHVAGGVGGAGAANRADFARVPFGQVFQRFKIDAVFEKAVLPFVLHVFHFRWHGQEVLPVDMRVGIAHIFGRERQQDFFVAAFKCAAEQVEQVEKGVLRAVGQGDVVARDVPAVFLAQEIGQRVNQAGIALRRGIIAHAFDGGLRIQQTTHHALVGGVHFGQPRGVAAAQHQHGLAAGQGVAQIVHQLQDAGFSGEFLAEF